jgi:hypothetical protein
MADFRNYFSFRGRKPTQDEIYNLGWRILRYCPDPGAVCVLAAPRWNQWDQIQAQPPYRHITSGLGPLQISEVLKVVKSASLLEQIFGVLGAYKRAKYPFVHIHRTATPGIELAAVYRDEFQQPRMIQTAVWCDGAFMLEP